jgi:hypothetical protein
MLQRLFFTMMTCFLSQMLLPVSFQKLCSSLSRSFLPDLREGRALRDLLEEQLPQVYVNRVDEDIIGERARVSFHYGAHYSIFSGSLSDISLSAEGLADDSQESREPTSVGHFLSLFPTSDTSLLQSSILNYAPLTLIFCRPLIYHGEIPSARLKDH